MKKVMTVVLLFAMAVTSFAEVFVDAGQAAYIGGTLVNVKTETMGKLDTTQEKALSFNYEGGKVTIPYDRIESWKYDEVLARHLGVIATTLVVMLKHRQRRHLFQIQFKDDAGVTQSALFEVGKEQPRAIVGVLQARVAGCDANAYFPSAPLSYARASCDTTRTAKTNVVPSTTANAGQSQVAKNTVTPTTKK
jgi:hypothetical protein